MTFSSRHHDHTFRHPGKVMMRPFETYPATACQDYFFSASAMLSRLSPVGTGLDVAGAGAGASAATISGFGAIVSGFGATFSGFGTTFSGFASTIVDDGGTSVFTAEDCGCVLSLVRFGSGPAALFRPGLRADILLLAAVGFREEAVD